MAPIEHVTIKRVPGTSTLIGGWLSALEESRTDLISTLEGIGVAELHAEILPGAHSIGAILWHVASVELWWTRSVLLASPPDEPTCRRFGLSRPGEIHRPPESWELAQFLALMAEAHAGTLSLYSTMTDEAFLTADRSAPGGTRCWSPEWILYNLLDHEANHRGQIAMLKRLLRLGSPRPDTD